MSAADVIRIRQFTELISADEAQIAQVEVRSSVRRGREVAYVRVCPVAMRERAGADAPAWVEELGSGTLKQAIEAARVRIDQLRRSGFRALGVELPVMSPIDGAPSASRREFRIADAIERQGAPLRKQREAIAVWAASALFQ